MSGAAAGFLSGTATLVATASPPFVTAYGNSGAVASLTTGSSTVTVTGGVPPYTHSWALSSSAPYSWTISAPSDATTAFTAGSVPPGVETVAEFIDTVTDSTGAKTSVTVEADANNGQPYSSYTPSGGSGSGLGQLK